MNRADRVSRFLRPQDRRCSRYYIDLPRNDPAVCTDCGRGHVYWRAVPGWLWLEHIARFCAAADHGGMLAALYTA